VPFFFDEDLACAKAWLSASAVLLGNEAILKKMNFACLEGLQKVAGVK
jgi:hypothetical protein